jgi:hypothetical protein
VVVGSTALTAIVIITVAVAISPLGAGILNARPAKSLTTATGRSSCTPVTHPTYPPYVPPFATGPTYPYYPPVATGPTYPYYPPIATGPTYPYYPPVATGPTYAYRPPDATGPLRPCPP